MSSALGCRSASTSMQSGEKQPSFNSPLNHFSSDSGAVVPILIAHGVAILGDGRFVTPHILSNFPKCWKMNDGCYWRDNSPNLENESPCQLWSSPASLLLPLTSSCWSSPRKQIKTQWSKQPGEFPRPLTSDCKRGACPREEEARGIQSGAEDETEYELADRITLFDLRPGPAPKYIYMTRHWGSTGSLVADSTDSLHPPTHAPPVTLYQIRPRWRLQTLREERLGMWGREMYNMQVFT